MGWARPARFGYYLRAMAGRFRVNDRGAPSGRPRAAGAALALVLALGGGCSERAEPAPTPRAGARALAAGCGKVTFQGCCQGQLLWYCKSSTLRSLDCAKNPACGWSAAHNVYECGMTTMADPTGNHPRSCGAFFDAGVPDLALHDLAVDLPSGDLAQADAPKAGDLAQADAPKAGDLAQADAQTDAPKAGDLAQADAPKAGDLAQTADLGPTPDQGQDSGSGCGGLTFQGCCAGGTLRFCGPAGPEQISCAFNPKCGWDPLAKVYDCGTAGAADPAGVHPLSCPGSRGGDAGAPAKDLGPDAAPDAGPGCGKLTIQGCCDGQTLWYCSAGKAQHYSCAAKPKCGWSALAKWYYCGTAGTAEPGGTYPMSCTGLLGDGGPPPTDTGPLEAGPDTAPAPDTAAPPDQAPGPDLASIPDISAPDHPVADAPAADAATPPPPEEGGCGCALAGPEPRPWAGLPLLLAALLLLRRRTRAKYAPVLGLAALLSACGDPALEWSPTTEQPDAEVTRRYQFSRTPGVTIPVLTPAKFAHSMGQNPLLPRTDAGVLALARQVFLAPDTLPGAPTDGCGEQWEGTVLGALTNPHITDLTRARVDQLMALPIPKLTSSYQSTHFHFYFTENDPDPNQNVTLAHIKATAQVLEKAWGAYITQFTTPKHYLSGGKQRVAVRVYYLGSYLYGSTSSYSSYIQLNSKKTVSFRCKRESTPVHELFHRVQYTYGYVSGASDRYWAVEGTASWSQKYLSSHIGDYLSRFGSGLGSPDKALFARKYDAVHLWVYLGRWTGSESAAVARLWQNFSKIKDLYRYPLTPALDGVLSSMVGRGLDHRWLVEQWSVANLLKDSKAPTHQQTYAEQGQQYRCEGSVYGPLPNVAYQKQATLKAGVPVQGSYKVNPYGSDYHLYSLDPALKSVDLQVAGDAAGYAFNVAQLDGAGQLLQLSSSGRDKQTFSLQRSLGPGGPVKLGLIVTAMGQGGAYTVTLGGK